MRRIRMRVRISLPRWGIRACVALSLLAFAPQARAAANIGRVLDVSGEWRLWENGRDVGKIELGQAVTSMSTARPRSDEGWLVIHLVDDSVIRCEVGNLGACARPLVLNGRPAGGGRFFRAIVYLLTRQPELYEIVMSRGRDEDSLREAVVVLDRGTIDLGPVFGTMREGRYHLRLSPASPDPTRKKFDPLVFDWRQGASSKVTVAGLTPGLYRVLMLDEQKDDEPTGVDAWILVSDVRQFPKVSAKFQEAVEWSREWRGGAARRAERTFLRAYLDSLTQPPVIRKRR
jgi:hypothetical protein